MEKSWKIDRLNEEETKKEEKMSRHRDKMRRTKDEWGKKSLPVEEKGEKMEEEEQSHPEALHPQIQ